MKIVPLLPTALSKLTPIDRLKYKAIVIADMHSHGIVEAFVNQHINCSNSFAWKSRFRFCWLKDLDILMIQHCSGMNGTKNRRS